VTFAKLLFLHNQSVRDDDHKIVNQGSFHCPKNVWTKSLL